MTVEEETMIYSSTSNLKICLYELTTCVRIPLDIEFFLLYEGRSEIIETITILSKGLNVIQNNLHSHQNLHIWGLGLNYLTASFNGYNPVSFLRLIPPLPRSMSHYLDVHCTVSLIYCRLNEQATINSFASKVNLYQ